MAKSIQAITAYLTSPISNSDTEIEVTGLNDIYGNQVAMAGTIMYATIEPRSQTNQEIISFTDIEIVSENIVRLTGITRGLAAQPSETGTAVSHGANVEFILSNNPQFYDAIAFRDEDETITGAWGFNQSPEVPTPTNDLDAANKEYADNLAILGSPDASTTAKGISRLSASPSTSLGTFTVTIASPAVFTLASHGLTENDSVQFTTTGSLPTGLTAGVTYYVIAAGLTSSQFQVSATYGGSAVNTTGSQSGTHTLFKTTPVAVGQNDTKMLTQDLRNAANGAGGNPSSSNLFETQYDTSNGSTKTATTISFAAGTKTIADSGNGFLTANFRQGTQIIITGSASNDGTYTIVSVAAGAIVVAETLVNESAGASVEITSVTTNKLVRYNSDGDIEGIPSDAFFGDGSDGDVIISVDASLSRDMYYNNLTINTGITLSPKGYRIFVKGTLTCTGTGKIASNGGAGGAGAIGVNTGVAPAGGAAGGADYTGATLPTPKVGVVGGAGGGSPGNGATGTAVTLNETMTSAVAGGAGGAGSYGSPGTGGAAGSAGSNPVMRPRTYQAAYNLYDMTGSTITRHEIAPTGGSGGGGGGNGGNNMGGGGGGSGSTGGFISIFANTITTLTVEALGGAGGAGGATNIVNTGGGGGGAGGNGGFILIFYGTKTTVTATVTGGAAGAGGVATAPATNSGVAGTAGNAGLVLQIQI